MKNLGKKICFGIVAVIMLIPAFAMAATFKTEYYTDKAKALEAFAKFEEEHAKWAENNDYDAEIIYPVYKGTTALKTAGNVSVQYLAEGQEELFTFELKDNEIVATVKDYELYKALLTKKTITESDTEVWEKLAPYITTGDIGLEVRVYFKEGINDISYVPISDELDGHMLFLLHKTLNTDPEDLDIKEDENGKYFVIDTGAVLLGYNESENSWSVGFAGGEKPLKSTFTSEYLIRYYTEDAAELFDGEKENTEYLMLKFSLAYADSTLSDEETKVSVSGAMEDEATLTVAKITTTDEKYAKLNELVKDNKVIGAYEVKVTGDYAGSLKLTFTVDSSLDGKDVTVFHQKADGTIEKILSKVEDGTVTVEVSELSPFVLVLGDVTKDNTPTLGVPSYVGLASIIVLTAGFCLVKVLKRD